MDGSLSSEVAVKVFERSSNAKILERALSQEKGQLRDKQFKI